jgi:hypothetical protein
MLDSVYTELELRYYIDFLEKMAMKKYRDDFNTQQEMTKALEGHIFDPEVAHETYQF